MKKDQILENENKLEEQGLKRKKDKKGLIVIGVALGAVVAVGVATGIALAKPKYYTIFADDNQAKYDQLVSINNEKVENARYKMGEKVVLKADVLAGYTFDGWYFNGKIVSASMQYTFTLSSSTQGEYEARYSPARQNISLGNDAVTEGQTYRKNFGGGELIVPTGANTDEQVGVRFEPETGYELDSVSYVFTENPTSTSISITELVKSGTFVMPTVPITMTATFRKINYTFETTQNNGEGEVIIKKGGEVYTGTEFNYKDKLEIVVNPNLGYKIDSIEVKNGSATISSVDGEYEMPAGNVTIEVNYKKVIVALTNGNGTLGQAEVVGEDVDKEDFVVGKTVTLKATPNTANDIFLGWTSKEESGKILSLKDSFSFEIEEGSENIYYAIFFAKETEQTKFVVGDYQYAILKNAGRVELAGFKDEGTQNSTVTIPSTVQYNGETYPVVGIANAKNWTKRGTGEALCNGGAFQGQENIQAIDFSNADNLVYIGSGAFMGTGVTAITLPGQILSVGAYAFRTCLNLESADFSQATKLEELPYGLFYVDFNESTTPTYSLKTFIAPTTLKVIGGDAFFITGLPEIDLRNCTQLERIEGGAFESCRDLRLAYLPQGKENAPIYIGAEAFGGLDSLLTISLPVYATIEDNAFLNSKNLVELVKNGGTYITQSKETIERLGLTVNSGLPAGIQVSIVDESQIKVGENFAFYFIKNDGETQQTPYILYSFKQFAKDEEKLLVLNKDILQADLAKADPAYLNYTGTFAIYTQAFRGTNLERVVVGNGITSIGNRAFNSGASITSIDMSGATDLTIIGEGAFQGCSRTTSISLPASVEVIGKEAFYGMNYMKKLDLSHLTKVTRIEEGTFREMKIAEEIILPDTITYIGSKAFSGADRLLTLTIPESVTDISEDVFATFDYYGVRPTVCHLFEIINNSTTTSVGTKLANAISKINRPNGYTHIMIEGETSKVSKTNAKMELGVNGRTIISESASSDDVLAGEFIWYENAEGKKILAGYYSPAGLKIEGANDDLYELVLPTRETSYEIMANFVHYENKLANVTIPNCVTKIGSAAFQNCKGLESISLPASVTEIGDYAFQGCNALVTIEIPSTVTTLGAEAFDDCRNLQKVYISSGSVYQTIKPSTFYLKKDKEGNVVEETKVYVLKTILDDDCVENENYESNGDEEGDYYILTRV